MSKINFADEFDTFDVRHGAVIDAALRTYVEEMTKAAGSVAPTLAGPLREAVTKAEEAEQALAELREKVPQWTS